MKKIALILLISLSLPGLAACGQETSKNQAEIPGTEAVSSLPPVTAPGSNPSYNGVVPYNTITVNSTENVSVVPDVAEVVYSVRTKETEAADCQRKNSESVSQVIALLEDLEVAKTSIQTSDYYMNPVYSYSGNTPRLTGYEAVTTLTVSDLPIDNLDTILAQSVSNGINTVQSITYQASRYDESYREALERAVASACEKANVLANASGAFVGSIISIQETSGYSEARYTDYARSGMMNSYGATKEMALEDTATIMPGEIRVEAGIIVEYQLIPKETP